MGFVLLGLMTLNQIGMTGAVLQMFSHGIIAGLLFAIVGRIATTAPTRAVWRSWKPCTYPPSALCAWAFVIAGMASMAAGLLRLRCELQVLVGAWKVNPWWVLAAGIGIVVGVAYTWRALQKAFFGDAPASPHMLEQSRGTRCAIPGLKLPALYCWQELVWLWDFIREFCSTQ